MGNRFHKPAQPEMKKQNGYNKKKEGLRKCASFFFSLARAQNPDTKQAEQKSIYMCAHARTEKCVFKRIAASYWPGLCGG